MSLDTLQSQLEKLAASGELTVSSVAGLLPAIAEMMDSLPPISFAPLTNATFALSPAGANQTLTLRATLDWGLFQGVGVVITAAVDATSSNRFLAALDITAPPATTLNIPGIDWFALTALHIRGASQSYALWSTGLAVPATVSVGATLTIKNVTTTFPITIGEESSGLLQLTLDTSAIELPSINDVLAAFGGGAKAIQLPSTINSLLDFSVQELFVRFDPSSGTVSQIGVQIGKDVTDGKPGWPIIPGFFTLDSYTLGLNIVDPLKTVQVGGLIRATGKLGSVDIGVSAIHPASGGWSFNGYIGKDDGVPIGALVGGLAHQFGVTLPDALTSFTLNDFEFAFDTQTYDASGHFTLEFDVNGTPVDLTVSAALTHQAATNAYKVAVDAKLMLGTSELEVTFGESPSTFTASWTDAAHPLEFTDIAARFGFTGVPPIPASLDLQLVEVSLTYDFGPKTLAITAKSKSYGSAAFVARDGKYFFGVRIDEKIHLTDLPLLKSVFSPYEAVVIEDIQAVISSDLDPIEAAAINQLLKGEGLPQVPGAGLSTGVALSMTFQAGSYKQSLSISTGEGGTRRGNGGTSPPPRTGPASGSTVASSRSPDGTVWYDLQKKFGPVSFQKVGIRYQSSADKKDGALFIVMNAGLDAGGLTISVLGLGVSSPLTTFQPRFNIDGLAVSLAEGPVEVSGGLMGTVDPLNFYGELVLGFSAVTVSALGGYAEYEGHPSFFLYAVVDYPIGGPLFFFVTGIAAGLGFNRALVIPDITGVTAFPLVAWARGIGAPGMDPSGDIGAQVTKVVSTLSTSGVVAPALGAYWLALGVRFTSFEIIDAFALLTVTFGARFEIDLLGVATLAIPPKADTPIARAELALEASFAPDEGLLSVEGQLTNNSYVLDPAAHLTGGFAFYSWFAGEHEGDFVVTLGGYNPNFTVPAHYPKIPRLGLNWQVVPDELTIQGDLYFALTSNAVMAGGELSAVWSSGPIRAWFTVWADFLMIFKPFHYFISAGIDLGASFSIKILFVHVSVTIHVGVGLNLWGPPFAGVATVHLYIISFDIHFGDGDPQQDTTLPWDQFVDELLPAAPPARRPTAAPRFQRSQSTAAPPDDGKPVIVQVSVTQGLVKTLDTTPTHPWYLVSGETFQCQVSTAIPFKTATWAGIAELAPDDQQPQDEGGHVIQPNTAFSAGIAGISAADFHPALSIDVESEEDATLYGVRVLRNAPKALWETKSFSNGVPQVDPNTGLTSTTIPNALSGFVLIPEPPTPDHTLPIPLPALEFTLEDVEPFTWSDPTYPTTDSFTDQTVAGTITDANVAMVRGLILGAMAGQSITVDTAVDVQRLSDASNDDLMAAPKLSLLGEQRTTHAAASEAP